MKTWEFTIEKLNGSYVCSESVKTETFQEAYSIVARKYRGYVIS